MFHNKNKKVNMMGYTFARTKSLGSCIAAATAMLACGGTAQAVDFQFADGWEGSWNSSISLSSNWRSRNADSGLYGQDNGPLVGKYDGTGNNGTDEGNLNYRRGDVISTQAKLITEVGANKGDLGFFLRGKAWYDYAQNHKDVHYGNQPNGYRKDKLSDKGFERLARFDGTYLLDAYVYDTFDIAGNPLQVRVGNQVVNWGESMFIQGVNQINPIDLPSFRKPGVEVKEVFLPVPILLATQSLGDFGTVEAFWQAKWENTPIEGACGNYWGVAAGSIGASPGSCNSVLGFGNLAGIPGGNPASYAAGAYIPTLKGDKARNSGQFGASFRRYFESIDSEIGLYAMKIHSRTPVVSVVYDKAGTNGTLSPISAKWEYPEDVKVYGASISSSLAGWSVSAELGHHRGVAVQKDANDFLYSALFASGFGAQLGVPVGTPFGPYGDQAVSAYNNGDYYSGYARANKTQLQFNAIKAGNNVFKANQYILVAELGMQWNNLDRDHRYGRGFIFGPGSHSSWGDTGATNPILGGPLNVSKEGRKDDGYFTRSAWGYRLLGQLTYSNIFNTGVSFTPSLFFSHDVRGWSIDSQFAEDRMALGLGAKFNYAKKYTLDLGITEFNRNADYDPLRDRGFYSAAFTMNF